MYACRLRDAGASASEIAKALDQKKKDVRVLALLDTLEYLKRGGRISKTAALAGNLLSIKPVIAIVDGEVAVLGKARGSKNGCNMLREEIAKCNGIDFSMPLCLGYTGLEDSLLQKYIEDNTDLWKSYVEELPISSIGSTIGTHTGPGGICVAFSVRQTPDRSLSCVILLQCPFYFLWEIQRSSRLASAFTLPSNRSSLPFSFLVYTQS